MSGWSVPTSALKQQKETSTQSKSQSKPQSAPDGDADTSSTFRSRKRKRDNARAANGDKITKSNIDGMWKKHIEGQTITSKAEDQKPGPAKVRKEQHKPTQNGGEQKAAKGKKGKKGKKNQDKGERNGVTGTNRLPLGQRNPANPEDNVVEKGGDEKASEQASRSKPVKESEPVKEVASPTQQLPPVPPSTTTPNLTPLQQSMRQKLLSSRFRHLNETLYTTPSSHALDLFTSNPELFEEYHAGFSRQVAESWPSNPVDGYIQSIKARGAVKPGYKRQKTSGPVREPLPKQRGVCTFADLGCGDAPLARALSPVMKSLGLKFLSYDLHAPNSAVTKADISALPLEDGSVDVTIFCLSLMGTNWVSFVEEAWRILRSDGKGECWVSEVKSRFGKITKKSKQAQAAAASKEKPKPKKKKSKGGKGEDDGEGSDVLDEEVFAEDARSSVKDDDETDISTFIDVFHSRGFVLKRDSVDKSNKMFIEMAFIKHGLPTKGKWASEAAASRPPPRSKFGNKTRFIDTAEKEGLTLEEETKALKPCVYKTR